MDSCGPLGIYVNPRIYGSALRRDDLYAKVGRLQQVAGITPFEYSGGRADGVRALEVRSGGGLRVVFLADRALDPLFVEYKGVPLCWQSANGVVAGEHDFFDSFFGGLMTTCGLTNFGPAGEDRWGSFKQHGRINHIDAENVSAQLSDDGLTFEIYGQVRETRLFGESLVLRRWWSIPVGGNSIELRDVVSNEGASAWPHMMLYHCNAGFPLLADGTRIHLSHSGMRARDTQAEKGLKLWNRGGPPDANFQEQVFIHDMCAVGGENDAVALIENSNVNGESLGLAVFFSVRSLPAAMTWRMLGYGTYVMAVEPANCAAIQGRSFAKEHNMLKMIEPGESVSYSLRFLLLDDADGIEALRGKISLSQK
ncbi:MAG: DUF4432 family protein [Candidatus Eremiobacteraeota bacterium]|nr:DUF4432 family protein [Candidatus Eremiobacteraeota bacterium]